jgi:hypothetical protein
MELPSIIYFLWGFKARDRVAAQLRTEHHPICILKLWLFSIVNFAAFFYITVHILLLDLVNKNIKIFFYGFALILSVIAKPFCSNIHKDTKG